MNKGIKANQKEKEKNEFVKVIRHFGDVGEEVIGKVRQTWCHCVYVVLHVFFNFVKS